MGETNLWQKSPESKSEKYFHLYAYSAADCTDPEASGIMRAENPLSGKRARAKSPVSSGMMADILHMRGALRDTVSPICGSYRSMGLALTPQRVYENISHYSGLFRRLLDRLWAELLRCRYLQVEKLSQQQFPVDLNSLLLLSMDHG